MAYESLRSAGVTGALAELFADVSDLLQKEIRLAKAEVAQNVTARLQASAWMVGAGVLGLIAALVLVEAAVFAIASFGLALHWSCLLVAGVLAAAAAAAFFHGRSAAEGELLPSRTLNQVSKDIKIAKELT